METGYNFIHDVNGCVGDVLTFRGGKSICVTGDTSKTEQISLFAEKEIDYAFFCCCGIYDMGFRGSGRVRRTSHNIPYHMTTNTTGRQFEAENRMIVEDGEEILVE